ncbi:hypothetical protein JT318_gp43 [Pseudomonas phage PspYZU01]|uniref:Uncharacterized protein n=1 Tax=Pseudomonas phage PspYZU01 TaxID=1983555 RepID=A0A2U7NLP0_9CAUD|nr:hypothetical protein JT318_gp43 [Pseudomonas phage PspYZU01]ASD51928.1 hypothetical protein PspYZU01_43 [Pseudomonas phage PspYZU01]
MTSIKDSLILILLIALHYIERVNPETGKPEGISPGKPFKSTQEEADFLIQAGAARQASAEHAAGKASAGHRTGAELRQVNENATKTPSKSENGEGDDNEEEEEEDEPAPAASTLELPALKERATALGLTFPGNVAKAKLLKLVEDKEAELASAGDDADDSGLI